MHPGMCVQAWNSLSVVSAFASRETSHPGGETEVSTAQMKRANPALLRGEPRSPLKAVDRIDTQSIYVLKP